MWVVDTEERKKRLAQTGHTRMLFLRCSRRVELVAIQYASKGVVKFRSPVFDFVHLRRALFFVKLCIRCFTIGEIRVPRYLCDTTAAEISVRNSCRFTSRFYFPTGQSTISRSSIYLKTEQSETNIIDRRFWEGSMYWSGENSFTVAPFKFHFVYK